MTIQSLLPISLAFLFSITFFNQGSAQLSSGLVAKYSFDRQTTNDESGNLNHATGFKVTPAMDRFGNSNAAYFFDGDSSTIYLPDSILIRPSISVSLWIKTDSKGIVLGQQDSWVFASQKQHWVPILYVREDHVLNSCLWGGVPTNTNTSNSKINDNAWHHIVIQGNSSKQEIYIDNRWIGQSNGLKLLNMPYNQLGMGISAGLWQSAPNTRFPYKGIIDDVSIYDRMLSVQEIDTLFKGQNTSLLSSPDAEDWLRIYPNPTSNTLNIELQGQGATMLKVLDLNGKLIEEYRLNGEVSIDVSGLRKGSYLLEFLSEEENSVPQIRRFVKQ